jgi:hypothetical protein
MFTVEFERNKFFSKVSLEACYNSYLYKYQNSNFNKNENINASYSGFVAIDRLKQLKLIPFPSVTYKHLIIPSLLYRLWSYWH